MPAFEIVTESSFICKYYVEAETKEQAEAEVLSTEGTNTGYIREMFQKPQGEKLIDSYEVFSYIDWVDTAREDGFV